MKNKPWAGRFRKKMDSRFEQFSASIKFDQRLALYDLFASKAHLEALCQAGILSKKDSQKIQRGLVQIEREIRSGKFKFREELEDVHMNIEARLFELIGESAGKLHTGRSRNDLVVADLRLLLKEEILKIDTELKGLLRALVAKAEQNLDLIMPGMTHTRFAQPILFSHWLLAYAEMLIRDQERFADAYQRTDLCPLGSGALAGTNYQIDRKFLARRLGFSGITENSLDAVSDRDFALDFLFACAVLMMHLSRLSEELIWLSGEGFEFFELPEALCTGSSIMPNKKNPDSAELIRGKTGRVYGHLVSLLSMMKATPLAYNRDFQEDKEPVFDSADTVKACLEMMRLLVSGLKVNAQAIRSACEKGYILATDLADYLVKKGMGFRQAHQVVGKLVRDCEAKGKSFAELSLKEFQKASPLFGKDVYQLLSLEASVAGKSGIGSSAPLEVKKQLKRIKALIKR